MRFANGLTLIFLAIFLVVTGSCIGFAILPLLVLSGGSVPPGMPIILVAGFASFWFGALLVHQAIKKDAR